MRNEEIKKVAQDIIDTIEKNDNAVLREQFFFYELKESLRKLHDCYHAWQEYDKEKEAGAAPGMNTGERVRPQVLITDINEIKQLKFNLDEDLLVAICTLVDRFKEQTELNIQGISIEMHVHSNSRQGYFSILNQIITGVKTQVEL